MSPLYERLAATEDGARRLAVSRLKREALRSLHIALTTAGITQAELAKRLGIRKSAVSQTLNGDGNLRVKTIAEYLHALGFELDVRLVHAGEPRRAMLEERDVIPAFPAHPVKPESDAPETPTPHHDVMVLPTGDANVLVSIKTWSHGHGSMHFEGDLHRVPITETRPAPAEFKPIDLKVTASP